MSEQITVLTDELGLQREYREVKRKAIDGDLVIYTKNGRVARCYSRRVVTPNETWTATANSEADMRVLEPSDIVRIDGERFRLVNRKAAVGERVVIVNAVDEALVEYGYDNGQIYEVVSMCGDEPDIRPDGTEDSEVFLDPHEYRVLEPLTSPLSSRPATEQASDNIATLTTQYTELATKVRTLEETVREQADKLRIARLDIDLINEGVADELAELKERIAKLEGRIPRTATVAEVNEALHVYQERARARKKPPQQVRDEIVERAKADVKTLLSTNHPNACVQWGVWFSDHDGSCITDECEFVVNRERRTVVALVRDIESAQKRIIGRGTAKCAPNDVFNVNIGRAIALRRALGLEVPAEYLSVPGPTEVRVGDVVKATGLSAFLPGTCGVCVGFDDSGLLYAHNHGGRTDGNTWAYRSDVTIIDDSREDNAGSRKEVAA
ncbi:hypothetical protein [Paenibacillus sp. SN-8-1]|uniref:hypothetical protein n=1 Tax=Paenibacillus sp. SN-8-1 TaxID=3435409 RepID=UPI003D9A6258